MTSNTSLKSIPQLPPKLDAILEAFKVKQSLSPEGMTLLNQIEEAKRAFAEGSGRDDTSIQVAIKLSGPTTQEAYQEAFIDYMGITFHYSESKDQDAAWYFYAQALNCQGAHDAWENIHDRLCLLDLERQKRAKGGRQKAQKHTGQLVEAFIKVIEEKRPPNGWKNKKELIDAALPTLQSIQDQNGPDSFPLYENLERTAYRWLRVEPEVCSTYLKNASSTNTEFLP